MQCFLFAPTNSQLDHSEYEHMHLGFLHAYGGKQQTGSVPSISKQKIPENQMEGHHPLVRHAHSQ
jgi:hypothetical protein